MLRRQDFEESAPPAILPWRLPGDNSLESRRVDGAPLRPSRSCEASVFEPRPAEFLSGSMDVDLTIREDDLTGAAVAALLREHLDDMYRITPPESVYALDLDKLRAPEITFWSAWEDGELVGCGALKELDARHGEIKSMRTARAHRRRGVAARLLEHIIDEGRRRGYESLSLETGSTDAFEPARALYTRYGFERCGPFGEYGDDPHSFFMTKAL